MKDESFQDFKPNCNRTPRQQGVPKGKICAVSNNSPFVDRTMNPRFIFILLCIQLSSGGVIPKGECNE